MKTQRKTPTHSPYLRLLNYSLCLSLGFRILIPEALSAESFDWPQWQGPDRNAVSKETGLLQEWPREGPPLAWKTNGLGSGYSAPSVAKGQIFGMSNRGDNEVVWSISESDCKTLWVTNLGTALTEGKPQGKEGGGCTPTIDGDRAYVLGLGGDLVCLQTTDGTMLWKRNLVTDLGGILPTWRYNESPLVDGDKVICTPGGDEATIVALNKMTGELIWQTAVPELEEANADNQSSRRRSRGPEYRNSRAGYASALAIHYAGQRQYLQFTSKSLVGVAATSGKLLWRYDRPANGFGITCSTPVYQDGKVFAASAYRAGGGLARLSANGDAGIAAEEVWFSKNMENHHGGMLVIDGALYGSNGGNGGGYLICLDFETGGVLWNEKDREKRRVKKGSVAYADGRIYYRTEEGEVVLIEPNRMNYIERGRFEQPDRSYQPAWTHPIIANGKLYIRDQDSLYCYDVKRHDGF